MPYSHSEGKDLIAKWHEQIKPDVVADIGPGAGTYSKLLRPIHRGSRWIALEAWAPYLSEFDLFSQYDHCVVCDVRHVDWFSIHHRPDLVIAGDVLEHMDKVEALAVIESLKVWADNVIVSIPIIHWDQDAANGNWSEIHRHDWTFDEMHEVLADGLKDCHKGDVIGVYWWSAEACK